VPMLFGAKFLVSKSSLVILALGAFFRLARGEPFTAILLHTGRTKRLALANIASATSVAFAAVLMYFGRNIEDAMLGRLLGELTAFVFIVWLSRDVFRVAMRDHLVSVAVNLAVIGSVSFMATSTSVGEKFAPSITLLVSVTLALTICTMRIAPELLRMGFHQNAARPVKRGGSW
jgi:uncharacterized membrane protein (UPF0136 family)